MVDWWSTDVGVLWKKDWAFGALDMVTLHSTSFCVNMISSLGTGGGRRENDMTWYDIGSLKLQ